MGKLMFIIASALDVATTRIALDMGVGREGNPLMVDVVEAGVPAMIVVKFLGFFLAWGIISLTPHHWRKPLWWLATGLALGVVINNLIVIGV